MIVGLWITLFSLSVLGFVARRHPKLFSVSRDRNRAPPGRAI
jgi:hypothetical protein